MSKKGKKKSKKISSVDGNRRLADNRKARYEYEILETLETGLELLGTEVKSITAADNVLVEEGDDFGFSGTITGD